MVWARILRAYRLMNGVAQYQLKIARKIWSKLAFFFITPFKIFINQHIRRYRTITGVCNNQKNPKWGKSLTPYGRLQPASFADGIYAIRKSISNRAELPGARIISNEAINRDPFKCETQFRGNHGGVMFGQLMAHDHGMRQMIQPRRKCCKILFRFWAFNKIFLCSIRRGRWPYENML